MSGRQLGACPSLTGIRNGAGANVEREAPSEAMFSVPAHAHTPTKVGGSERPQRGSERKVELLPED